MMWSTLEARYRQAHQLWENAAYAKLAEKDALISDLTEKLRKLEDDFAYNFNLLNIREQENLRCRSEMTELMRRLSNGTKEIKSLQILVTSHVKTISKLEFLHDKDKQTLQKLSLIMRNMKNDLQSQKAMTQLHLTSIQDKDEQIQEITKELDELREQNRQLKDDNESLKLNLTLSSSEYKQIETNLKRTLSSAEDKIRAVTNEKILLESENVKLVEKNAQIEKKYLYEINKNNELTKQIESVKNLNEVNQDLNKQIIHLKEQINKMTTQNNEMKSNYNYLKQTACTLIENRNEILHVVKKLKDTKFHSNNPERNEEFESLRKQNYILRDVIKKLRFERDENIITTTVPGSMTAVSTDEIPSLEGEMHNLSRQQFDTNFRETFDDQLNNISAANFYNNSRLNN